MKNTFLNYSSSSYEQSCLSLGAQSLEEIIRGSPGSTPFPRRQNQCHTNDGQLDGSYIASEQLDISSDLNSSYVPLAPPPTPDTSHLEDEIIREAKRREELLKLYIENRY